MKKRVFSMILAALIAASSMTAVSTAAAFAAETATASSSAALTDFEYTITDNTAKITKYKGSAAEVVIPSEIEGSPVKVIGRQAFYNNNTVTSITIPSGATTIEDYAFYSDSSLTSVSIPDSVETIGSYSFGYCSALTSLKLPANLNKVGDSAFYSCIKISSLTLPQKLETIGSSAFRNWKAITSLTIPKTVKSVGAYAFNNCSSLKSVSIVSADTVINGHVFSDCTALTDISVPSTWTSIPDGLVQNCSSLEKFTIPSGVTKIGNSAFYGCSKLPAINLPTGLTEIGNSAFYGCSVLQLSSVPQGVTVIKSSVFQGCIAFTKLPIHDKVTEIGSNAFSNCKGLTELNIPSSVKTIGTYAFSGCNSLTEVTIPSTVTSLKDHAFSSCNSLVSFTLESSKTAMNTYILENCSKIQNISLPSGLKTIPAYFAYNCSGLKAITIPDTVTSIAAGAFRGTALEKVTLPSGITSLGDSAFAYCKKLSSINIPDGITAFSNSLFSNCTSLKDIPMGNKIVKFGTNVFDSCTGLTSVTIPERITDLGNGGFVNCTLLENIKLPSKLTALPNNFLNNTKLSSIDLPDTLTSIGNSAFESCKYIKEIKVPSGVTSIGNSAFRQCTSLEKINIPSGITKISGYTFYGCTALQSISIPESITSLEYYAFSYSGLKDVVLPDSVTQIAEHTFYYCKSLSNVKLSSGITTLPNSSFGFCTALDSITIPENIVKVDLYAFNGSALREVFITNKTETIYDHDYTFGSNKDLIIYSTPDSAAKAYADKHKKLFCDSTNGITTLTDKTTGVSVKGAIESGTALKVNKLDNNVFLTAGNTNIVPDGYYEISLIKDKKPVAESGNTYEIILPCKSESPDKLKTVFVDGDTVSESLTYYKAGKDQLRFTSTKTGRFAFDDYSKVNICDTTDAYIIVIGSTVTMNLKSAGGNSKNYRYTVDVAPSGTEEWTNLGNNVAAADYTYTPEKTGLYDFRISVKDTYGYTGEKTVTVKVNDPLKNISTINKTATMLGNKITISGTATGGTEGYKYKFSYKSASGSAWKDITSTGTAAEFAAPSAGSFNLKSTVTTSDGKYEEKTFTVSIKEPLANNSKISSDKCIVNEKITMTGSAANGMGGYLYAFYYKKSTDTKWTVIGSEFAKPTTAEFTPSESGKYDLKVIAKDSEGNKAEKTFTLTVYNKLVNNSTVSAETVPAGTKVTLNAKASGGYGGYTYALMFKKSSGSTWSKIGEKYGTASTGSFTPGKAVPYDIMINIKDSSGKIVSKTFKLNVTQPLKNTSSLSAETINLGEEIKLNGSASGGTGPYTYALMFKKASGTTWSRIGEKYGSASSGSFKPGKAVPYDIMINVKDSTGKIKSKTFRVNVLAPLKNTSTISADTVKAGDTVTLNGAATGGTGPYTYAFMFKKSSGTTWSKIGEKYGTASTGSFKPGKAVPYDIMINVKDSTGKIKSKTFTLTVK